MNRLTIYDLAEMKRSILAKIEIMKKTDKEIDDVMHSFRSYNFYNLERRNCRAGGSDENEVDKEIWQYLIGLYHLNKYMLCTEYQKLTQQIENYDFPEFTVENAEGWLISLKALVYENVQKLIEDVFNRITQGTYHVGGWNGDKKKRNNNGIDKFFIITTNDQYSLNWYSGRPTITDDLEKACYIIDGKQLPEITIKETMRRGKIWESENEYFWIRICQNGNTHYKIKEPIRKKLNLYGSRKGVIGENIRIKIFEKD